MGCFSLCNHVSEREGEGGSRGSSEFMREGGIVYGVGYRDFDFATGNENNNVIATKGGWQVRQKVRCRIWRAMFVILYFVGPAFGKICQIKRGTYVLGPLAN